MTVISKYKKPPRSMGIGKGWWYESGRHRLARLGFKTGSKLTPKKPSLLYKTPIPHLPLTILPFLSKDFLGRRADWDKVEKTLKKQGWTIKWDPSYLPIGVLEAWRGHNYLLMVPTHWNKLMIDEAYIKDKDVGDRLKKLFRKPYPYRIGEEAHLAKKSTKPIIKNFKDLDDFDDWIYTQQQKGLNPIYKPIAKNTFKILRYEKIV